jgi:hypothetical protein
MKKHSSLGTSNIISLIKFVVGNQGKGGSARGCRTEGIYPRQRRLKSWFLFFGGLFLLTSCGGGETTSSSSAGKDPAGPNPGTSPEQGGGASTPGGATASFKFVLQSIVIPPDIGQYSSDINKDGQKDNAFIEINKRLRHMDLEELFHDLFKNGDPAFLIEGTPQESQIKIQMHFGQNDSGTTDRFTGNAKFKILADSAKDLTLMGGFNNGQIKAGPADFQFPVPKGFFGLKESVMLKVNNMEIVAALANGQVNGSLTGSIPWSEVKQKLLPSLAERFTNGFSHPGGGPDHGGKTHTAAEQAEHEKRMAERQKKMKETFDLNKDGKVTVDEIENSPALEKSIKADLDLDGDGTKDAVSFGFGYSAVSAQW